MRIRNLVAMGKQVVLTGDLNVVRDAIDTAGLYERLRKEGMTMDDYFSMPSRRIFGQLLIGGKVKGGRDEGREKPIMWDLGRLFHPDRQGMYTCWDTKKNSRPGNFGSRIDYVLCSPGMKEWFSESNIQEGLMGSDHCPVFAVMKDVVQIGGQDVHLRDLMNPVGTFKDGQRLQEWSANNLLPLSARLIAEFDRRQSIKDMFFKKPAQSTYTFLEAPTADALETGAIKSLPASPVKSQSSTTASHRGEAILPTSTPLDRALKRTPSGSSAPQRPPKKSKAAPTKEPSGKGQSSLMGFFKPKLAPTPTSPSAKSRVEDEPASPLPPSSSALSHPGSQNTSPKQLKGDILIPPSPERIIDQVQSRETWSKLLGKRVVPKCEHGEDCISLVTKKPGANKGRWFYICPRPVGPSGAKETGTDWRCGTFIWSSDWTSKSQ